MPNKILYINQLRDFSLDQIIFLYKEGYRLEGIEENKGSASFIVSSSEGFLNQAAIFIDGEYKGITDENGRLTISDLSASDEGISHSNVVIRQGFNASLCRITVFPNIETMANVQLDSQSSQGKGNIRFFVNCLGEPCKEAIVIIKDNEVGTTRDDGTLLARDLDIGSDIPYTIRKEGFFDSHGIITVAHRVTMPSQLHFLIPIEAQTLVEIWTIDQFGAPISNVEIIIDNTSAGFTDEKGKFITRNLETGKDYSFIASKPGFNLFTVKLNLTLGVFLLPIIMSRSSREL